MDSISQSQTILRKEQKIMKLVGIDITKYEHAAFIMNASTSKSLCVPFSSRTIKKVLKTLYGT